MSEEETIKGEALASISGMNNEINCTAIPEFPFCIVKVSDKNQNFSFVFYRIHWTIQVIRFYEKKNEGC